MVLLSGAGKRNRTSDLRITNALLYQLSYSGRIIILTVQRLVGRSNDFSGTDQVTFCSACPIDLNRELRIEGHSHPLQEVHFQQFYGYPPHLSI